MAVIWVGLEDVDQGGLGFCLCLNEAIRMINIGCLFTMSEHSPSIVINSLVCCHDSVNSLKGNS